MPKVRCPPCKEVWNAELCLSGLAASEFKAVVGKEV